MYEKIFNEQLFLIREAFAGKRYDFLRAMEERLQSNPIITESINTLISIINNEFKKLENQILNSFAQNFEDFRDTQKFAEAGVSSIQAYYDRFDFDKYGKIIA